MLSRSVSFPGTHINRLVLCYGDGWGQGNIKVARKPRVLPEVQNC